MPSLNAGTWLCPACWVCPLPARDTGRDTSEEETFQQCPKPWQLSQAVFLALNFSQGASGLSLPRLALLLALLEINGPSLAAAAPANINAIKYLQLTPPRCSLHLSGGGLGGGFTRQGSGQQGEDNQNAN